MKKLSTLPSVSDLLAEGYTEVKTSSGQSIYQKVDIKDKPSDGSGTGNAGTEGAGTEGAGSSGNSSETSGNSYEVKNAVENLGVEETIHFIDLESGIYVEGQSSGGSAVGDFMSSVVLGDAAVSMVFDTTSMLSSLAESCKKGFAAKETRCFDQMKRWAERGDAERTLKWAKRRENAKGKITGKKKGTAVITVKSGKKSVKCKVTVK